MKKYTQEEISEVIRLHRLWLEGSSQGVRADFRNTALHGVRFCGVDLRHADFRGADLVGVNFYLAILRDTIFRHATLHDVDFCCAILRDADLYGVNLSGADFCRAIGDGKRIRTYQFKFTVNIYDDRLQIASQNYSQREWFNDLPEEEIAEIGCGALEWWNTHKGVIKSLCELQS